MVGTVKWFNAEKGYGFIGTGTGPDMFVHYSDIKMDGYKELIGGEEVIFDAVRGDDGRYSARNVRRKSKARSYEGTRAEY